MKKQQYNFKCLSFFEKGVKRVRRDFVETLWSNAHTDPEWSWKSLARQKLSDFEGQVLEAVDAGVKSYSGQTTWTLTNSIIYSISLISTIGKLRLIDTFKRNPIDQEHHFDPI